MVASGTRNLSRTGVANARRDAPRTPPPSTAPEAPSSDLRLRVARSSVKLPAVTISTQKSAGPTGGGPVNSGPSFEVVRRGYDRDQVDSQLRDLRERLATAEAARKAAEKRATTEAEKRPAREGGPSQESFGFRAEKILRLAEQAQLHQSGVVD